LVCSVREEIMAQAHEFGQIVILNGAPRGILPDCARRLQGLPVLFVGLRCPIEII